MTTTTIKSNLMKVSNMKSNNSGNKNPNQFIIENDRIAIFQSYDSIICVVDKWDKSITLGCDWDYSQTTMKYLYQFLFEFADDRNWCKKEVQRLINEDIIYYDEDLY